MSNLPQRLSSLLSPQSSMPSQYWVRSIHLLLSHVNWAGEQVRGATNNTRDNARVYRETQRYRYTVAHICIRNKNQCSYSFIRTHSQVMKFAIFLNFRICGIIYWKFDDKISITQRFIKFQVNFHSWFCSGRKQVPLQHAGAGYYDASVYLFGGFYSFWNNSPICNKHTEDIFQNSYELILQ